MNMINKIYNKTILKMNETKLLNKNIIINHF